MLRVLESLIIHTHWNEWLVMKTIDVADFKEQCLRLVDELDADGLIITRDGKPVAKVTSFDGRWADLIGSLRGQIEIKGDIFSTGIRWDADRPK